MPLSAPTASITLRQPISFLPRVAQFLFRTRSTQFDKLADRNSEWNLQQNSGVSQVEVRLHAARSALLSSNFAAWSAIRS